MRDFLRRLCGATVWHQEVLTPEEWDYRWTVRLWMPVYYFLAFSAGVEAFMNGSPNLNRLFSPGLVDAFGVSLMSIGVLAFIAVIWPRLWIIEAAALVVLVGQLSAYVTTVLIAPNPDNAPRGFVAVVLLMTMPRAFDRLTVLGSKWALRRAARLAVEEVAHVV